MWSAPLIIATDIRNLTSDKAKIITNPEVIAIDQDPAIIRKLSVWSILTRSNEFIFLFFSCGFDVEQYGRVSNLVTKVGQRRCGVCAL